MAKKNTGNKLALPSGKGTINVKNSEIKKVGKAQKNFGALTGDTLNAALHDFDVSVSEYNAALKKFMTGYEGAAFWQGEDAYDWFSDAIDVLNALCRNYEDFYFCAEQYAKLLVKAEALKKNKGSKLTQALLNSLPYKHKLNGCTPNIDTYKIQSVIGVDKDRVTAMKTEEAKNTFKSMKKALEKASASCTKMGRVWASIAENTKGGIKNFATTRAQNRCTGRVQDITMVIADLSDYSFDLLFQ